MFGRKDFFPVRKDMIDNAIGYRRAGLTDMFTGVSRLPEGVQKQMRELADVFMGDNAFKYLSTVDKTVMEWTSYSKVSIVVRSVFVGVGNLVSSRPTPTSKRRGAHLGSFTV